MTAERDYAHEVELSGATADPESPQRISLQTLNTLTPAKPPLSASAGSCAVILLRTNTCLFIANLGDCRAVAAVGGMSKMLTRDHKATDPQEKVSHHRHY